MAVPIMSAPVVLVTDGEQRASLAAVRSLGRAGFDVRTCSARGRSLAGASRYCRREAQVVDAMTDPDDFLNDVLALAHVWNVDVLIPISEAANLAVLPARSRFGGVRIPVGDHDAFRGICDKRAVLEAAARCGIAVPAQISLRSPDDIARLDMAALEYPIVIKPSRSICANGKGHAKARVAHVIDRSQLEPQLARVAESAYPVLLQRRVHGPGIGIFLLLWEGRTLGVFSHRRIREKPVTGGVSVYRESIPADGELVDRSRALLEHFGWQGVAMVEYKIDEASGTPYLMEINARFWGSLQLAIDAGVDFPTLLVRAALGEQPSPVATYRPGIRSRWWWGDVDHLIARLRNGNGAELPDAPGRWGAMRDFLTLWRPGDRNEVLRLDDPWPIVRETIDWANGR